MEVLKVTLLPFTAPVHSNRDQKSVSAHNYRTENNPAHLSLQCWRASGCQKRLLSPHYKATTGGRVTPWLVLDFAQGGTDLGWERCSASLLLKHSFPGAISPRAMERQMCCWLLFDGHWKCHGTEFLGSTMASVDSLCRRMFRRQVRCCPHW